MSDATFLEIKTPEELKRLRLPASLNDRLQSLLDRQDQGDELTAGERREAEGPVELAEFLSLLRLRADASPPSRVPA